MNIQPISTKAKVSSLIVDADLDMGTYDVTATDINGTNIVGDTVKADTIDEKTAGGAGIAITPAVIMSGKLEVDHIGEKTASHNIVADNTVNAPAVNLTADSTAGATLAVSYPVIQVGAACQAAKHISCCCIKRAGVYTVKYFSKVARASGAMSLYKNKAYEAQVTPTNANTEYSFGNLTFAKGDHITMYPVTADLAADSCAELRFYNADGGY